MKNPALEVYKNYEPAGKESGLLPLVANQTVLEIGFGAGKLLESLAEKNNQVHGVDASEKLVREAREKGFKNTHVLDVSEDPLPFKDDHLDAVYAYEVFEHLTNPHRMFFEVRRCLKEDGLFFFSIPAQEIDMGYGPSRHTFVYPGLMERKNIERFIMQMHFAIDYQFTPNPGQWLTGHNFILRNKKREDVPDVVEAVVQDYNVRDRYGYLLSEEKLEREIAIEVQPYMERLRQCADTKNWDWVIEFSRMLITEYPEHHAMYPRIVQTLLDSENADARRMALAIGQASYLPLTVRRKLDTILMQSGQQEPATI